MRPRSRHALVLIAVFLAAPGRGADAGGPAHPRGRDPVAPFTPWQWNQDGQPVRDEPWRQSSGPFGAMLVLTDHPDAVFEAWAKPPSPDYRPYIPTVSEVRRGDTVAAMIVFARCAPDPSGHCRSDVSYRVLKPDGSLYAEHRAAPFWNEVAPPETALQLAQGYLGLQIEPDDPLGTYQIHAIVSDRVSGRQISLSRKLRVLEAEKR